MQIWQLFIILKQPVLIFVTVHSNLTKLTNHNKTVLTSSTSALSFTNGGLFRLITVLSVDDDDDDGILSVSDEISSFGFYSDDDDDVKRHQKKITPS